MKTISNLKKYDFINLELSQGIISDCLVYQVSSKGIHIYPMGRAIEESDISRAIAKIFIRKDDVLGVEFNKLSRLFYAVNSQNSFLREALNYHMRNESERRKN